MIFNKTSRVILAEWVRDHEAIGEMGKKYVAPLKKAAAGNDCKLSVVSDIAQIAIGHINIEELEEMTSESKMLMKDIRNHYDIEHVGMSSVLTKKLKTN